MEYANIKQLLSNCLTSGGVDLVVSYVSEQLSQARWFQNLTPDQATSPRQVPGSAPLGLLMLRTGLFYSTCTGQLKLLTERSPDKYAGRPQSRSC